MIRIPEEKQVGYVAGLLDGEGTVAIYRRQDVRGRRLVFIQIGNTVEAVIDHLLKVIGGTKTSTWDRNPNHRRCYVWRLQRVEDALLFLRAVRPFLIVKAASTDEAIRLLELKCDRTYDDRRGDANRRRFMEAAR